MNQSLINKLTILDAILKYAAANAQSIAKQLPPEHPYKIYLNIPLLADYYNKNKNNINKIEELLTESYVVANLWNCLKNTKINMSHRLQITFDYRDIDSLFYAPIHLWEKSNQATSFGKCSYVSDFGVGEIDVDIKTAIINLTNINAYICVKKYNISVSVNNLKEIIQHNSLVKYRGLKSLPDKKFITSYKKVVPFKMFYKKLQKEGINLTFDNISVLTTSAVCVPRKEIKVLNALVSMHRNAVQQIYNWIDELVLEDKELVNILNNVNAIENI